MLCGGEREREREREAWAVRVCYGLCARVSGEGEGEW